jgi:hypothetical protein
MVPEMDGGYHWSSASIGIGTQSLKADGRAVETQVAEYRPNWIFPRTRFRSHFCLEKIVYDEESLNKTAKRRMFKVKWWLAHALEKTGGVSAV